MDYREPADITTTTVDNTFVTAAFDAMTFQIIDVSGKDSRRVVALTVQGRELP